jgi:pimeloyl-ACP methyl ester carboxylesterase
VNIATVNRDHRDRNQDHYKYILFAQHGWADTNRQIGNLARNIASPDTLVIAPNLGWLRTWWRMEPLIASAEQIASTAIAQHDHAQLVIVGHSMGGLIWLEILQRRREWWHKVHSLTLVASPVGGSDLGKILDPFGWGLGIARDLAADRRWIAADIAQSIPTLSIAGDIDGGSDGTVLVQTTRFDHANWRLIPNLRHEQMKDHPQVAATILEFWQNPQVPDRNSELTEPRSLLSSALINHLREIPGITDAHPRDFDKSEEFACLSDGYSLRVWRNPVGVDHVFLADPTNQLIYAGFVGWRDRPAFEQALTTISQKYAP